MNIRFLITAAVAAVSIMAFAQKPPVGGQGKPGGPGGPGGPGMRRGMPPELEKELALTPAQKNKIKAINDKYTAKFKALGVQPGKPPAGGARPDFSKFRPLMEARRKEVDAVYTAKQKAIIAKWRAAHPRPGGAPGQIHLGGAAGPGGQKHGG